MRLSIIAGLYNMQREAPRTLTTMSAAYQGLQAWDYEIILVDNGSSTRLAEPELLNIASNVRYRYIQDAGPSPTNAINAAVQESHGDLVTVVIDGARMFSPGLLQRTLQAFEAFDDPFVYAPSMHLGAQLQNDSSYAGYDQVIEDELLASIDWRNEGYELFSISNVKSVPERLARATFESNCFTVRRTTWERVGGYDAGFANSAGGGLANWELFGRFMGDPDVAPVLLLGEATFHQFHGGASTNQPRADHPIRGWLREYQEITGAPFVWPKYDPVVFGSAHRHVSHALYEDNVVAQVALARALSDDGSHDAAITIALRLVKQWPHDPSKLELLSNLLERVGRRGEALSVIDDALAIAPTQAELHVMRGIVLVGSTRLDDARLAFESAITLDPLLPEGFFHLGHLELRCGALSDAVDCFETALRLEADPPAHYFTDLEHARAAHRGEQVSARWPPTSQPVTSSLAETLESYRSSVEQHYAPSLRSRVIRRHLEAGSFSLNDLQALVDLVRAKQPLRILVVGAFLGLSTKVIVDTTSPYQASVVSVDPNLRHRVFDAPLDHARAFVRSDRCEFIDGFFGAQTAGGTLYDLQRFKPVLSVAGAEETVSSVEVGNGLGTFDLILLDADAGAEVELSRHALEHLASPGVLIIAGSDNKPLVELLASLHPGGYEFTTPVPNGRGFAGFGFR